MDVTISKEALDAINDTLLAEAAGRFLMARFVGDENGMIQDGNELVFLSIQRQNSPRQWVEIGQTALLKAAGSNDDLKDVARNTAFFIAEDDKLQVLATLSCASIKPAGIYSREEVLIKFARGEVTLGYSRT